MTLSVIPAASAPAQHSASNHSAKSHSMASTSPNSERDFSDCLNLSDASAVKTPTSQKSTTEKNSDKQSSDMLADHPPEGVVDSAVTQVTVDNLTQLVGADCQLSVEINTTETLGLENSDSSESLKSSESVNSTETDIEISIENELGSASPLSTKKAESATLLGSGVINAQDDPWLQQLDASRKALQSPRVSASTSDDANTTISSTEKVGAMGLAAQALTANRHVQGVVEGVQAAEEGAADQASIDDPSTHKDRAADVHSAKIALRAESSSKLHLETDLARQSAQLSTEDSLQKSAAQGLHSAERFSRLSTFSSMENESALVTLPAQGHDLLTALRQQNSTPMRMPEHAQPQNIPLPLRNSEQSAQALHEQVQFLLNRKLDTVEIRLDPPELGNLQIKLQLNQDQAQVGITVHNTQARELLEQTLPRLREMLAQQGILLGQTQIQQQGQMHDQQARGGQAGNGDTVMQNQKARALGDDETELLPQKAVSISPYQVDYYA
ncbi:flagellar hook-length control protein FliK [Plesiomonas sp.]|uniref:flagellar hook-length control protein FliK n=1 Tax=Plesiomonas sp. TaxID=2486279 RepID=UPI003F2AD3B4